MRFLNFLILSLFLCFSNHATAKEFRLVSIGGSVTDIIYALDAEGALVGRDSTSLHPDAQNIPDVGYLRALSIEGVLSLKPTHIITVQEAGPPQVLELLKQSVSVTQLPKVNTLEDIALHIQIVGDALNKKEAAQALRSVFLKDLAQAMDGKEIGKKGLVILAHTGGAPMIAGVQTAANLILDGVGAENAAKALTGYKPLTPEAVLGLNPDFILISTRDENIVTSMKANPALSKTDAVQNVQVFGFEAQALLGLGIHTPKTLQEIKNALKK